MKKRKIIIAIIAVVLIGCLTVSLILYINRKESKMAVFESREQFVQWLVAGDYGAAPSRFHSTLGGYPDLEADVSYLVPLIMEFGIPSLTCDEENFSYIDGYVTLSPYAQSDFREPQMRFRLRLNGYEYTVYATYINDATRNLYENSTSYIAGDKEGQGLNITNFLSSYLRLYSPKEISHGGKTYVFYEAEEYKSDLECFLAGMPLTDRITWGFISENVVYRISFDPGEHKENYDAMTSEIPKLVPIIIPYAEFVESEVE